MLDFKNMQIKTTVTYYVSAMTSKFKNSIILLTMLCEYGDSYTLLEVDIPIQSFYGGQFGKIY